MRESKAEGISREAALAFVQKAMRTHVHLKDWSHVAKCHLHTGCILSKLNRHDEAIRCLAQVLSMVESGELEVGGTQPQKLCLVAVGASREVGLPVPCKLRLTPRRRNVPPPLSHPSSRPLPPQRTITLLWSSSSCVISPRRAYPHRMHGGLHVCA